MKRAIVVALGTGAVISSAAAISIGAAIGSPAQALSRTDYEAALQGVAVTRERALARCGSLDGLDADLCRTEAGARAMVRAADLEAEYRHSMQASRAAQRAHIDARYLVDRTRCDAMSGFRREKCLIAAHAAKGRALLEAAAPYGVRTAGAGL